MNSDLKPDVMSSAEYVSPFAKPVVFLVSNVLLPLLAIGACAYMYWLTCGELKDGLPAKAVAVLAASAVVPICSAGMLMLRPKRIPAWPMVLLGVYAVLFLWFGLPVLADMGKAVDGWMLGATPILCLFGGTIPVIFAGVARIATADWRMTRTSDVTTSLLCLVGPPLAAYLCFCLNVYMPFSYASERDILIRNIVSMATVVIAFAGCAVFFVGLIRIFHKIYRASADWFPENFRRFAGAALLGIFLPVAGLALNTKIPFPADFANPWAWGLAITTGFVLMLPPRDDALGLVFWFLKLLVAPFVLYFFLLFLPFLPLSILAILAIGTGFLILSPTLLFAFWSREVARAYAVLRKRHSRLAVASVAIAGLLVMPVTFAVMVEVERMELNALVDWHTKEDFDLPPAPMPVSQKRAEKIMNGVNDYTFGSETPFLSGWRTWRVYGGMYMADKLRNELNMRILGKAVNDDRDWRKRHRNDFGSIFGMNSARRSINRGRSFWVRRPPSSNAFSAEATSIGNGDDARFAVLVKPTAPSQDYEFIADMELPAGAWIEGMRLKMADGEWKTARASERKAAEWVYNKITEQRRDPSIVTLDTPTAGKLKVFPVDRNGREVELTVRLPDAHSSTWVMKLDGREIANPLCAEASANDIFAARDAAVSVVPQAWMDSRAADAVQIKEEGEPCRVSIDGEGLMRKLRRYMRESAASVSANGTIRPLVLEKKEGDAVTNEPRLPAAVLNWRERSVLNREMPGVAKVTDDHVDGWFMLETEDGRRAAVPFRRGGGGAVVFARLKGAKVAGEKWSEGAKAWELENRAFLKPALDVRRELLDAARRNVALTTQTSYIVVETSAQEKALSLKEKEALHGDKSYDFDESTAVQGDAPGFFVLAAMLFLFFLLSNMKKLLRR